MYLRGNPFYESERGPTLGMLDPLCWDFCLKCDSLAFTKRDILFNIVRPRDGFQGVFSPYYFKLREVISRYGIISVREGIFRSGLLLASRNSKLVDPMFPCKDCSSSPRELIHGFHFGSFAF